MKVLISGATGTLGRQVARRALDEGHDVYCLVRSIRKAAFLKEWGANLVLADLCDRDSLDKAVRGMEAIIDCATARPTDSAGIRVIDWAGKVSLIQAAEAAGVKRYVFFSIMNAHRYPHIPLMDIKHCTEKFLAQTSLEVTILRPGGFFQGLIGQYAIPILDQQQVWISKNASPVAHMDTQDIARFAVAALRLESTVGQAYDLAGPKAWTPENIIQLCESLSGKKARTTPIPVRLLKAVESFTRFFEWGVNIADRLAFTEVVTSGIPFDAPMDQTYASFGIAPDTISTLEDYLQDYFNRILKKLKELEYDKQEASKKRTPFKSTSK
ncbi:NmrA family NAD(P)-binding protein [Lyngbya confervoides]|uniref:NmrA family NAD(P)-binding protein n=1 Tax=Lyngbya confervoides BDU141951 TaxID=1574623 RepID=A0ABD4T9D6_9CYAN|nr:NmrA family NAD(P)-binding protein [Lyngbya confervoides]MCM1985192.1 NmrA family NAD(P)-binding protein [Lyngbya confervoides BDU141951]